MRLAYLAIGVATLTAIVSGTAVYSLFTYINAHLPPLAGL